MNAEQVKSAVRWMIATFGPIIISHGYASASTLEMIGGAVVSLIPLIFSMLNHTQSNAVAVVATIAEDPTSPVKGVVTTNTAEGRALARDTPSDTIVTAGTPEATAIAKPGAAS